MDVKDIDYAEVEEKLLATGDLEAASKIMISPEYSTAEMERLLNKIRSEARLQGMKDNLKIRVPFRRYTPKVGRNDACGCGSGLKYKKCCGRNNA